MNRTLEHILPRVQKPARYTGGEYNAVVKDRRAVDVRYALCFPDTYEIGMSNLGVRILYGLMNEMDGVWCERVFAPWGDMEEEMRREGIPLYGLESGDSIADFDLIGFSLGYEMAYTNVLNMLDLAGLPLRSGERTELSPIVVAGGTCAFNPEPLAPFVDLFVLGEGEDVSVEIIQLYRQAREEGWGKEEFLTAYTPYQAEMSQGILQSIFEYQTMICQLTGMDVSNASVYDGATAAAEAAAMCRDRKRRVTLISAAAHPDTINTVRTYCYGTGDELRVIPVKDGRTDPEALRQMLAGGDVSGVYIQQPNFFGQLEEAEALGEIIHQGGALYILGVNPIAAAILKTPRDCGADVAVGEGQPLGMPLGWGGPYLGFMATVQKHMRQLPAASWARRWTAVVSAASSCLCRPVSSTSAGRRPRPTCALTRRCAPSPPPSTCPSWGRTGFGRWASSATLRPTTWPQSCAGCPACPCATPAPSSTSLSPICPNPRRCFPPWRRAASWGAGRWRAGCCGAPRRSRAAPSWTRPCPLSRRCWTDEADF